MFLFFLIENRDGVLREEKKKLFAQFIFLTRSYRTNTRVGVLSLHPSYSQP